MLGSRFDLGTELLKVALSGMELFSPVGAEKIQAPSFVTPSAPPPSVASAPADPTTAPAQSAGSLSGQMAAATGKHGGSLAWRNNNPGNIRAGDFTSRHGSVGVGDRGFAAFKTPEEGRAAGLALLQSKSYRDLPLADVISRWAPPADKNNTPAYISGVAKRTGLDMRQMSPSKLSPDQLGQFFDRGITVQEGWVEGKQ